MVLQAPNGFVYVIAAFLAMIGILATFPTPLSIPDLASEHAAWFIFLAWFMLAAASIVRSEPKAKTSAKPAPAHEPVHEAEAHAHAPAAH